MKSYKSVPTILFSLVFFISCTNDNRDKLCGTWQVDSVTIDKERVTYDLISRNLTLDKNGSALLPVYGVIDWRKGHQIGKWSTILQDTNEILKIESSNGFFGKTFVIDSLQRITYLNGQHSYSMTIHSDSVMFFLTKSRSFE